MFKLDDIIGSSSFHSDPYPAYRKLRESDPVQWSDKWNCWVLTRYHDVRESLADARRFSNVGRVSGMFQNFLSEEERKSLKPLIDHYSRGLINVDPPDHTRIRRLLHRVFKPSIIQRLRQEIQQFVDDLIEHRNEQKELEVVRDLAFPLPVTVIARLFGIPSDETHLFTRWSGEIVKFMQEPQPTFKTCLQSQEALVEMREYIRDQAEKRRTEPQDDVLTLMVQAEEEGDRLSMEEILGTSITILIGGHETTTRLMTTTILEMFRHPDQRNKLIQNPELIDTAVEEFLRYCGPFHRDQRVAKIEVNLHGNTIKKGHTLLLMLAAANRDPAQFPDPDSFDIERPSNKHVAFGFGPHICLGAPLARLEMSVAINTLLRKFPAYEVITNPIEWEYGFLRGPKELRIRL